MVAYNRIPTLDQWKKDSSVALAQRKSDPTLTRIDELIAAFHKAGDGGEQAYLGFQLYFSTDEWLKIAQRRGPVNTSRQPAIQALFECVVYGLCRVFQVEVNTLPNVLVEIFGREMSDHGAKLDLEFNCAQYLTRAELKKYRLWFKKGLAYQFPWWDPKVGEFGRAKVDFHLADSRYANNPDVFDDVKTEPGCWGGFAMSMGREIYMAKHLCISSGKRENFYHSSYLGGEPVMCAGTMLITKGTIQKICTDSGHYQPTDDHTLNLLEKLRTIGVNIAPIEIQSYNGAVVAKGHDFVTARGNWASLLQLNKANVAHMNQRFDERQDALDKYRWLFETPGWVSDQQRIDAIAHYFTGGNKMKARERLEDWRKRGRIANRAPIIKAPAVGRDRPPTRTDNAII